MLQRTPDESVDGPLDAAAVAKAIRFYSSQPWRYTDAIVREIQVAVGVAATGRADAQTAQAVAVWQLSTGLDSLPLKVDGMAGPRTLPRLFAHGLNAPGEGRAFGEEAQVGVIDRWHERTPKERAIELVRLVNVHLEAAGVPPATPNPKDTGVAVGEWDSSTWQMDIGLEALSVVQPGLAKAQEVVDTIYHEARHAEQDFRVAQMRAGQIPRRPGAAEDERVARALARELSLPIRIAKQAVGAPLAAGSMQSLVAQGWYDSVFGAGRDHRDHTLDEVKSAAAAGKAARKAFEADPTPENAARLERAKARFTKAYAAYKDLPEENDAWATGPMTAPGVTRGAPDPGAGPGAGDLVPVPGGPGSAPAGPGLDRLAGALEDLLGAATRPA
jgi:hypothetical protein